MDESGFSTVHNPGKIIAPKGQKRVGAVTSWERGKNVTAICAMSATGIFVPPLFIFPRQRHSPFLERDGPPGAIYTCSINGWTNEQIFITWLQHFIKFTKPSSKNKVLLIMDNHNSHSTLEAYDLAQKNHVTLLTIPPHSSHRLQPLDVTFFGPLKTAYDRECDLYLKSRNLIKITPYEIAGLFNKAYSRIASLDKGVSGFKTTGIFPIDPSVFSDEDFFVTDETDSEVVSTAMITNESNNILAQQIRVSAMSQELEHPEAQPL
ncbi:MFS-type transporter clz9-like isoform X1 [Leptopilina heterotoma]|uniref:MFS-type transporter clz9-like isoform X1 n=1 Tax=Leptopilina heterotoma TaxID=63436 RepID=UPI001CAA0408|nr:MFS-type transporter clz9-like isoform X1 [Leptopilina heterotoma]